MGLKPTFKPAGLHQYIVKKAEAIERAILQVLMYLGELCVKEARSLDTYKDQTGNLRNSIGYVIVHNGRVVKDNFSRTARANQASGRDGLKTGRDLALRLAAEIGQGWALIVVAGMNYALSVESRGLDVLSSAEQLAQSELPKLMQQLKNQVKQA